MMQKLLPGAMALAAQRSVRMGNIAVPPGSATDVLSRYCRQLVLENDSDSHPYSLRGSSSMLVLNGVYHQVFCQHQLAQMSYEQVRLLPHCEPTKMLSGKFFNQIKGSAEGEDLDDFCSIIFEPANYSLPNFAGDFFRVERSDCWPTNTTGYLCVLGYPYRADAIALDEEGYSTGITATIRTIGGHYVGSSHAAHVHRICIDENGRGPMNGFSGGPVFHLGRDANGFFLGFAGVAHRGSDSSPFVHFVDSSFLLSW